MRIIERLFRKKGHVEKKNEERVIVHNNAMRQSLFGMPLLDEVQKACGRYWVIESFGKKVILVNPEEVNELDLIERFTSWRGLGDSCWEIVFVNTFMQAVESAVKSGCNEADITALFGLKCINGEEYIYSDDELESYVMSKFEIVEENEHELRLKFRVA